MALKWYKNKTKTKQIKCTYTRGILIFEPTTGRAGKTANTSVEINQQNTKSLGISCFPNGHKLKTHIITDRTQRWKNESTCHQKTYLYFKTEKIVKSVKQ